MLFEFITLRFYHDDVMNIGKKMDTRGNHIIVEEVFRC